MKRTTAVSAMLTGIGIGIPVTLVCMTLFGGFNPVVYEFLVWTVASALYGLISWLLFRNEEQTSLPATLTLHCLGCAAITTAAVLLCGYTRELLPLLAGVLPVFAVVYVLIFCGITAAIKREEKRINQALEQS